MPNGPDSLPPLGIGRLVSETFRLLFSAFGLLFPFAFVPALILALLSWLTLPAPSPDLDPAASPLPALGPGFFVVGLLQVLVGAAVSGIMALAAVDAVIGRRHTLGEYLGQTLRHLFPILVLGVLVSIAIGVGFVLFIVPGLYVIARYLVYVPAIVFEDAGFAGINRAQDLTRGYRWPLVGAVLVFGLVLLALGLVLGPLVAAALGGGALGIVIEAFAGALFQALVSIFTALVYVRLREVKEGMSPAQIAASID